ncbi:ParB N-terminal domain-containing protein [Rhizobium ruizarguesonis]
MDAKTKTWRDEIKVHPAADLFPMMSESELRELGEDIKRNGLRMPIYMWAPDKNSHNYQLVDGRNRLTAMELVGIRVLGKKGFDDKQVRSAKILWYYGEQLDPWEFVVSANIHRRHLTQEQKRDLVAKLLKATPEKSNRQIAATIGVDHKTVGAVREEREARGEIPHVVTITDTKGRQQPVVRKVRLLVSTETIAVKRMQQPQNDPVSPPPLQLSGGPIDPVACCVMRHREFVFDLVRAVPAETWTRLVSALQGDIADIGEVLEQQRKEQGSEADGDSR